MQGDAPLLFSRSAVDSIPLYWVSRGWDTRSTAFTVNIPTQGWRVAQTGDERSFSLTVPVSDPGTQNFVGLIFGNYESVHPVGIYLYTGIHMVSHGCSASFICQEIKENIKGSFLAVPGGHLEYFVS